MLVDRAGPKFFADEGLQSRALMTGLAGGSVGVEGRELVFIMASRIGGALPRRRYGTTVHGKTPFDFSHALWNHEPCAGGVAQDLWSAVSPTCSRPTPEALGREKLLCACRLEACDTADQRSALPWYGSWQDFTVTRWRSLLTWRGFVLRRGNQCVMAGSKPKYLAHRTISPQSVNFSKRLVFDLPVQEQQRVEGLILARGRHVAVHGQVAQKQFYFRFRGLQLIPGSHFVELDEALNSVAVSGFGSDGVMLKPEDLPDLVKQFEFGVGCN
jgi:hypothetical protein